MVIKYRPRPHKTVEEVKEPSKVEQQIMEIYQEAPVVRTRPARGKPIMEYYEPTPEQEEKIVELAKQLPPEERAKYIVEPEPTPTPERKRVSMMGEIMSRTPTTRAATGQPLPPKVTTELRKISVTPTLMKGIEEVWGRPEKMAPFVRLPPSITEIQRTGKAAAEVPVGFLATFEAYVRPKVPTPIGAITEPIFRGGKTTQAQFLAEHPGYALGGLLGEWAQAKYVWGPITEKAYQKLVPKGAKEWLRFGSPAKLAHKAKLQFQRFVPEYFKRGPITPGEIAIPPVSERVGLKSLEATELAWKLTQAPKTGGVWWAKQMGGPTTRSLKTWALGTVFKVAPTATPSFLKELREARLTPFATQSQLTRMGIVPYAPTTMKAFAGAVSPRATTAFGLGLASFLRGLTWQPTRPKRKETLVTVPKVKVWQPTFAWEREKFKPFVFQEPKKKEKAVPILKGFEKVASVQKVAPTQALKTFQKQVQKQIQIPRQIFRPPKQVHKFPKPVPFRFRWPEMKPGRKKKGLRGEWFLRVHPIPLPKQVLKQFSRIGAGNKRVKNGGGFRWRF